MADYIVRRIIQAVFTILIVSFLVFMLVQMLPGDAAMVLLGFNYSPEEYKKLAHELWLDRPLLVQYCHWLNNIIHGDFGTSIHRHERVIMLIGKRAPISFFLGWMSLLLSIIIGIPAGIISAIRRGALLDNIVTLFANLGVAIPVFWLSIIFIYIFGFKLHILPISGYTSPLEDFWLSCRKMIMPIICLSFGPTALLARQTRSSMLEVIYQDYIRTAWAKGLRERVIIRRHALKNAFIPLITILGVLVSVTAGGTVIVETVFNIPGMGRLIVDSVLVNDFVVVQGCVLVIAVVVAIANLIVDISYVWFDPRIRLY